jgi:hypothetical protein
MVTPGGALLVLARLAEGAGSTDDDVDRELILAAIREFSVRVPAAVWREAAALLAPAAS